MPKSIKVFSKKYNHFADINDCELEQWEKAGYELTGEDALTARAVELDVKAQEAIKELKSLVEKQPEPTPGTVSFDAPYTKGPIKLVPKSKKGS